MDVNYTIHYVQKHIECFKQLSHSYEFKSHNESLICIKCYSIN